MTTRYLSTRSPGFSGERTIMDVWSWRWIVDKISAQQSYNTTSTYGITPTPMTELLAGSEMPHHQGERR